MRPPSSFNGERGIPPRPNSACNRRAARRWPGAEGVAHFALRHDRRRKFFNRGRPPTPIATIVKRLADPNDDSGGLLNFGVIRFTVRDGVVERIILPAVD